MAKNSPHTNLLLQHSEQSLIAKDPARFKVVVTGRRWGKSVLGREVALKTAFEKPDSLIWIVTPTREMGKDIHWQFLKDRCKALGWKIKTNETNLSITRIKNRSVIALKTADNPDRLRGRGLDVVVLDEFGSMDQTVWQEILRPALTDRKGSALFISTPAGHDVLYELHKEAQTREGWRSWHYKTIDSPFIDPLEIEEARRTLDARTFAQEYEASFDIGGNPPYYSYSRELNHSEYNINPGLPVILTCDFNATEKPMSWVIGQRRYEHNADVTHWTKCFSYQYTNTAAMCEVVDEYFKTLPAYPVQVLAYGDYAGKKETSNSSFSDWEILQKYFSGRTKFETRIKPCKSIRDSIAATNSQLCNSLNQRRQFVNTDNCTALVKDWELCKWKDNGRELDEKDPLRGHACRAVDYYNDYEHSIKGVNVKSFKGFDN